jgi:hypothetical protein
VHDGSDAVRRRTAQLRLDSHRIGDVPYICEQAGLGWPPNARTLRAGLPRRSPAGCVRRRGKVARDNSSRLIPTNARKRETVAARHTTRRRRLYGASGSSDPAPVEPDVYPVWLSSEEVIGLIAYGRITALSGAVPGEPPFFERWKLEVSGWSGVERRYPLVRDMRWVIARIRWWQRRKRRHGPPVPCPLHALDRIKRGHVRWAIKHHSGTAASTLAQLRADVRQMHAARTAHAMAIERATANLCAEIAAEHIVAWGRPGTWRKRQFTYGIHEPIPPVFFANAHNTIRRDGWATCADSVTMDVWANWSGPDWGDVRFKRDDVLALLRSNGPSDAQVMSEDDDAPSHTTADNPPVDVGESPLPSFGERTLRMQFASGYISRRFITNDDKKTVELVDPYILICEEKLSALQPMLGLLEAVVQSGKPLLIIAEDVDGEALATLFGTCQRL